MVEETYAEIVRIIEPEEQPPERLSQYSVIKAADEIVKTLAQYEAKKDEFDELAIEFGGRTLVIGPPGLDSGAFVHRLAQEVPLREVRFRINQLLTGKLPVSEAIRTGFEFAKRNTPCLLLIPRIDLFARTGTYEAAVLENEFSVTSWGLSEVLVVATTSSPGEIDREVLSMFDKTYTLEGATMDDRIRVFEHVLRGRDDIDPTVLAELTDGWAFTDLKHLASEIVLQEPTETSGEVSREQIEDIIEKSRITPIGLQTEWKRIDKKVQGSTGPSLSSADDKYPEDFIEQLYLMAIAEDFQETQRVIENLNTGLPLSAEDQEFLSRYPFLLDGSPEDRLTRLLKAKRTNDRLSRIMGR